MRGDGDLAAARRKATGCQLSRRSACGKPMRPGGRTGRGGGATGRGGLAHVAKQRVIKRLRRSEVRVERRDGGSPLGAGGGAEIVVHDVWYRDARKRNMNDLITGARIASRVTIRVQSWLAEASGATRAGWKACGAAKAPPARRGFCGITSDGDDDGGDAARAAAGDSAGGDNAAAGGNGGNGAAAGGSGGGDGGGDTAPERPGGQRLTSQQDQPGLAPPGLRLRPGPAPLQRLLRLSLSYLAPATA